MINQVVTIKNNDSTWSSAEDAFSNLQTITNNLPIFDFLDKVREEGNMTHTVEFTESNSLKFTRVWNDSAYDEYLTYTKGTSILEANGMTVTETIT